MAKEGARRFKVGVHRQTGKVMLWMEAPCGRGFIPIIGWDDLDGLEEFASMLLDLHREIKRDRERLKDISDRILRQALEPEENPADEKSF